MANFETNNTPKGQHTQHTQHTQHITQPLGNDLDAVLEAEAEREALLALNGGTVPPTHLDAGRVEELKDQRVSLDQIRSYVRWRARDRQWAKASSLAEIPEQIGWELEMDPDIQESILEERNRVQSNPAAALQELMPRAIGNLEERLLNNEHNAAETVIRSSAEMMRVQNKSGGKQSNQSNQSTQSSQSNKSNNSNNPNNTKTGIKNEAAGDSGALLERRSLNRMVERFRGPEEE